MFQTLKNAWKIPELKNKILFTLMILVLYRLGSSLPMPWISPALMEGNFMSSGALGWLNLLSGGALAQATLFALSVSPYITASIVIQLLTVAIPKFEEWGKEGEAGKKKLSAITRVLTVVLALVTAIGYTMYLERSNMMTYGNWYTGSFSPAEGWEVWGAWIARIVLVLAYCAGASVIMWLAEKINEKGIGNGISIILFANIIARLPGMLGTVIDLCFTKYGVATQVSGQSEPLMRGLGGTALFADGEHFAWQIVLGVVICALVAVLLVFCVAAVVWFSNSERRIPVQYAKRVVGRKMYGGQSTNLPLKVNMSGVLPVIFAQSVASLPATICMLCGVTQDSEGFWGGFLRVFNSSSVLYAVVYLALIVFFAYFYSTIQFNPVEVANNLKKNGGFVPGIRPGRPTGEYLAKVLNKVTLFGAIFLAIIAVSPIVISIFSTAAANSGLALGGTSIIIVVGVALETVRAIEAQMLMRNYKGFLD